MSNYLLLLASTVDSVVHAPPWGDLRPRSGQAAGQPTPPDCNGFMTTWRVKIVRPQTAQDRGSSPAQFGPGLTVLAYTDSCTNAVRRRKPVSSRERESLTGKE